MLQVLWTLAWRLALLGGVVGWALRDHGAIGVVSVCLLLGLLLPNPVLDFIAALWHALRVAVWGPVQGRHFSYRAARVRVVTDNSHRRWVDLRDVRKILGFTASNASLAIAHPNGYRLIGRRATPHLCDEALLAHLRRQPGAEALKFRQWVERDIAFSARRQREHCGVRGQSDMSRPTDPP